MILDGMSDSIQGSRIENLQSREVDRQSPTGLIFNFEFSDFAFDCTSETYSKPVLVSCSNRMCLSVLALVRQQEGHLARKKLNVSTLAMGDLTAVLHVLEFQCHHCHLHYHLQQPNLGPFDILV